jgi:hypothetical protein
MPHLSLAERALVLAKPLSARLSEIDHCYRSAGNHQRREHQELGLLSVELVRRWHDALPSNEKSGQREYHHAHQRQQRRTY